MTNLSPGTMLTLDGEQYMVQDAGSPWSLEMPDASTLRFEVQQGDTWYSDPTNKNRSEVAMQGVISDGTEINVSYGMQVEPGAANSAAFCMLGQFHQAQGTAVSDLGPPFSIQLLGEKMSVVVGYTNASGANVTKTIFIDSADIVRGHTYAMNVQVVFGPNGDGSLTITRDGLTLVSYTGPLGYKGEQGVYWKEGIYRAAAPETLAADYSNLAVTTSTPSSTTIGPGVQSYTQYNSAGKIATSVTLYADGSTTTDKFNSVGAVYQSATVHADGSRDVYDYGVTGQSYIKDHRIYNTSGILTEFIGTAADGSKIVCDYAITGKSYTSDQLSFSSSGTLTTAIYFNNDGSTTTEKCNSSGAVIQTTIVHADGSRDVYDYGLTGQAYVSDHRVYNTAGTLTEYVGFAADGSKIVCDYAVSGKSYTSDQLNYDTHGVLSTALYHNNNGSTTTNKYAGGGLAQTYIAYANGSHEVYDYGITGQSYVADHRVYNAAGTLTEYATITANGSQNATAYAAGLQLSGGAGNDTFNSYGGDTFVFKGSFGNDVVNYFHAGDATGHDVLIFSAGAVPDFAHLQMAQSGNNVIITIDAHDTVTLTGVTRASLTAHDFIFT